MFEQKIKGSEHLKLRFVGDRKNGVIDLQAFSEELGRLKGRILSIARERQGDTEFSMTIHKPDGADAVQFVVHWERPENEQEYDARRKPAETNAQKAARERQTAQELAELKALVKKWPDQARGMLMSK